ncbi:MAG TPA: peptide-methionine (S)-S-oxide reductase MsrA [Pirellulaceae bacterium]|nr:peptide-methionine (S)-S-oxide reductase MsrA [Pirellulaceae bacterium]
MKTRSLRNLLLLVGCTLATGCTVSNQASPVEVGTMTTNSSDETTPVTHVAENTIGDTSESKHEIATFGAGCFWCVEAVFKELEGVVSVESGYTGGHVVNPSYEEVCSKTTGHAEVCRLTYDPVKISFEELLEVFWQTHDPTTLNQQGADHGPQYRSAIFYHSSQQKELAEKYKKALDESGAFRAPIVTEITAAKIFYKAEDYHQDYYALNPNQGYCAYVVKPKVDKVRKVFKDKLKKDGDHSE